MENPKEKLSAEQFIKKKKDELALNNKKRKVGFKDIGRKGRNHYEIESRTLIKAEDLKEKVFVFERLKFENTDGTPSHRKSHKKGKVEYRFGYYMIGKHGNKKGRWTWGQFAPMISANDLSRLLKLAKEEGTLL